MKSQGFSYPPSYSLCAQPNLFGFLLWAMILSLTSVSEAQRTHPQPVRTPANVNVNRKLPDAALLPDQPVVISISANPTDEEIYDLHIFEEPMVPMEMDPNTTASDYSKESNSLVNALVAFSQRGNIDDFTSVERFLNEYPQSRWKGALLTNLGLVYRRIGYFSKAMEAWSEAWKLMKDQKEHKVKVLADKTFAELLMMNAWLGRFRDIESLLEQIEDRSPEGPAVERVSSMKDALWQMKNQPGESFKCGPYALNQLLPKTDSIKKYRQKLMDIQSPQQGFSLAEIKKMAKDVDLDYQMAYRKPGSALIVGSVVHWKLDHYSALLKMENEYIVCQDATMGLRYGLDFWITLKAFEEEASGYFLVPVGTLPKGWRVVDANEGSKIFGKGNVVPDVKGNNTSDDDVQVPAPGCSGSSNTPMAQCNVHASAVSLHIWDRPIYYSPPVGSSIFWNIEYHHRDSNQPANFDYSSFGPKWTFNWLSYVVDDPNIVDPTVEMYLRGGGFKTFSGYNATTESYTIDIRNSDQLVRISNSCYELRHPDGSKEVYSKSNGLTTNGRKVFLTKVVDPHGNTVVISYDNKIKIVAITDAIGQISTVSYDYPGDKYKITKVTDPFGRFATFDYDSLGRLSKITDMIGIVSEFNYGASEFINEMKTPYGATSFKLTEQVNVFRRIETFYPLGEKEKVEYITSISQLPASEPVAPTKMGIDNSYINFRNTFFWDKKAMKEAPNDYLKAKIYHWLHGSVTGGSPVSLSPILESIKSPLENRVWYTYENQDISYYENAGMSAAPAFVGRVLDDGKSQLFSYTYNNIGSVTTFIDPIGRQLTYAYDSNQIDLLEVRQTTDGSNELLSTFTYNTQHLPLTVTDASGQTTVNTYNAAGQLLTTTNPKQETTTLSYDGSGYLQSITGAIPGSTYSFTYDGFGRVRTITDPEGYAITTDYDALDRPTVITYPDDTYEQIVYDRLDAVAMRDRMGRWSYTTYDSLGRVAVIEDALGRITQFIWCNCGSLAEIADPLQQITTWSYDLQGRVTSKNYADGSTVSYSYENTTSRLSQVTDALGQKTKYAYYLDDNLKKLSYTNAINTTPEVSFTYDPKYNRIATMTDGTGTTAYTYNPVNAPPAIGAGRLLSIDGPIANDVITYTYDSLGRVLGRSINGVDYSVVYDALSRITSTTNALGAFTYNYVNETNKIATINYPNGQKTTFNYFDNAGDQRLKQIINKKSNNSLLSKFTYDYTEDGQISKWTQQLGNAPSKYYNLEYDNADQLTSAILHKQSNDAIYKSYAYQYDKSGNRTTEQLNNSVTSSTHNNLNQLTNQTDGGLYRIAGNLSEFSAVTLFSETTGDTDTTSIDINNNFTGYLKVIPGNNTVSVTAVDYSGNQNMLTHKYKLPVTSSGINRTLTFDANGNTTKVITNGEAVTYSWDAADRLIKISKAANTTEFVYDGMGRRVAEKLNGIIIKQWLWCSTELCEERDANGSNVTKRFFQQGEQINGANYYFSKDHLGSIREMTDGGNSIISRYDYDPYGRRFKLSGSIDSDFGFTGHYLHALSGLHLAIYRCYDSNLGRWISRDPIEEAGGLNLYGYANRNPINNYDLTGLTVLVGQHPAVFPYDPFNHAAIVIVPDNPNDFLTNPYFQSNNPTLQQCQQSNFMTIGGQAGGSSSWNNWLGNLQTQFNYPGDDPSNLNDLTVVPTPDGQTDTQFIKNLINAAQAYQNDQNYDLFPSGNSYNSNSYVSGVISAAGGTAPQLPGSQPGYNHPLPIPFPPPH